MRPRQQTAIEAVVSDFNAEAAVLRYAEILDTGVAVEVSGQEAAAIRQQQTITREAAKQAPEPRPDVRTSGSNSSTNATNKENPRRRGNDVEDEELAREFRAPKPEANDEAPPPVVGGMRRRAHTFNISDEVLMRSRISRRRGGMGRGNVLFGVSMQSLCMDPNGLGSVDLLEKK